MSIRAGPLLLTDSDCVYQDYFYHNISNTPFTLGIVFPNKYGKYRVNGGLEVNDPQNRKDGNGREYIEDLQNFSFLFG